MLGLLSVAFVVVLVDAQRYSQYQSSGGNQIPIVKYSSDGPNPDGSYAFK